MPYSFTAEDFNKFSEDIINAGGDQATLTTLLADMNGTIVDAIAKDVASTEQVNTVTAENERLKKANMDLFLRVGYNSQPQQENNQSFEDDEITTSEYMKKYFNSLDSRDEK